MDRAQESPVAILMEIDTPRRLSRRLTSGNQLDDARLALLETALSLLGVLGQAQAVCLFASMPGHILGCDIGHEGGDATVRNAMGYCMLG